MHKHFLHDDVEKEEAVMLLFRSVLPAMFSSMVLRWCQL